MSCLRKMKKWWLIFVFSPCRPRSHHSRQRTPNIKFQSWNHQGFMLASDPEVHLEPRAKGSPLGHVTNTGLEPKLLL